MATAYAGSRVDGGYHKDIAFPGVGGKGSDRRSFRRHFFNGLSAKRVLRTFMSMAVIWMLLGIAFLVLSAHPFAIYPLSLSFARKMPPLRLAPLSLSGRPSVAICLSAYNEERVIVTKVEALLAMAAAYGPATVHVYTDCPADSTVELLTPYADRIDLVIGEGRRGKTFGLNTLIARTHSDLLLFTDANVVHDADALEGLARAFSDPVVGLSSARLNYVNRSESATSAMGAFYWSVEEAIKKIEGETVGIIGVDGAFFLVRRDLYKPAPPHLIDDFYVSMNVLIGGGRVVTMDDVRVEERSAVDPGEEFRRKTRIACQSLNVHRVLWKELRRMRPLFVYAYLSHRVLKWMLPFTLLLSALFFLAAIGSAFGWTIAAVLLIGAILVLLLGDRLRVKPASYAVTGLLSLAGVGSGVLQSLLTSRTYTVWSPADSVRPSEQEESKAA